MVFYDCSLNGCVDSPVRLTLREWEILDSIVVLKKDWEEVWKNSFEANEEWSEYRYLADWYFGYLRCTEYDGGDALNSPFPYNIWHNSIMYMMYIGVLVGEMDINGRYKFSVNLPAPKYDKCLKEVEEYELEERLGV